MYRSIAMSASLPPTLFDKTELPLMLSPAGSRVRTSAALENRLVSRVKDLAFGQSSGDLFASCSPDGLLSKTLQTSLVKAEPSLLTSLPRAGMIVSGNAYQRQPLAHSTDGTDGGVLPTVTASDFKRGSQASRVNSKTGIPLPQAIGGPPNPTWLEWFMGFPIGHTELNPSETPSSRKSQK